MPGSDRHSLALEQALPLYEVVARNYATESANRIHSDEVAAQYGFSGGLVPGIGNYAYLTHPVVEALGRDWLGRGSLAAKFLKPTYDGETVSVHGKVVSTDPVALDLELFNSAGTLCAVGNASLPHTSPPPDPADYPFGPLPAFDERPPATLASVPPGLVLGSLEFDLDLAEIEAEFLQDVGETLPIYRGAEAVCHPAFLLSQANQALHQNLDLGPWIHTASEVHNYSLPRDGEKLSLRGSVEESYAKRGHEFVVLDLALFANGSTPILRIKHTAIIRLRGDRQ